MDTVHKFYKNQDITYIENKYTLENRFRDKIPQSVLLPKFNDIKEKLPKPLWQGHNATIDCYFKAWEIAFSNIHNPNKNSGFVSPFIDAAFNGCIFMWDSCFMLMYGKYANHIFNFQKTLDNFYALQHKDGFISREISETDGSDSFSRFDPASTGPNVMPWCEYEYYKITGDKNRICDIFPVLLAYHQWMRRYRTWRDGSYWSCGWGCGMDNMPRLKDNSTNEKRYFDNGKMIWVDACLQQIISCNVLIEMAKICNRCDEISDIYAEKENLTKLVNEKLWDNETAFYYDLWEDNKLNMVKTAGSYWALLADILPQNNLKKFVEHLTNKNEFNRPNRVPTLSYDNPDYSKHGNYWRGSIWAPTNYMILKGLNKTGFNDLAFDIAKTSVENAVKTFESTNTLWENYAPEYVGHGDIAKPDFVGWSGLFPISILIEYVFGIQINADNNEIVWHINLTDEFGIENLRIGNKGKIDLFCKKRENESQKPQITIKSNIPVTVKVVYNRTTIEYNHNPKLN